MQNPQVKDLVKGTGMVDGYENTVYLRKSGGKDDPNQVRIDELVAQGYELIDAGDDTTDMVLYGIKYKKEEVTAETKEGLAGEKLAEKEEKEERDLKKSKSKKT